MKYEEDAFINLIDDIRIRARTICKKWGDTFAVDELVNEAWIRSRKHKHTNRTIVLNRAYFDMMDYIRVRMGRVGIHKIYGKEYKIKPRPLHFTNIGLVYQWKDGDKNSWRYQNNVLEGKYWDKGFLKAENTELIVKLLLDHTTTKRAEAMLHYYLESHDLKESAKMMGYADSTVCTILKKGQEDCYKALEMMGLVEV